MAHNSGFKNDRKLTLPTLTAYAIEAVMVVTKPHECPKTAAFGYGQIERALASVLRIGENGLPALRGRIQHLRRLGLTPSSGRGKVIAYDFAWPALWYLALILTKVMGRDPKAVVQLLTSESFGQAFENARKAQDPEHHVVVQIDATHDRPPIFGYISPSLLGDLLTPDDGRVVTIFNLSSAMHRLEAALAAAAEGEKRSEKRQIPKTPRRAGKRVRGKKK
jgi:hypothetical protein